MTNIQRRDAASAQKRAVLAPPSSLDVANRTCEFVASTTTIDSHGTIVLQNWRLDRYRKNPVILWAHDDDDPPIGTGEVRIEDGQLIVKVHFAEGTECAETCWMLVQQGVLRGVSVCFMPEKYSFQEVGDRSVLVYDAPELLEISLVSIPSNPDSLARSAPLPTQADSTAMRNAIPLEKTMQEETVQATESATPLATETPAENPAYRALVETVRERDDVISILRAQVGKKDEEIAALRAVVAESKKAEAEAYVRTFVGRKILERQVKDWTPVAAQNRAQFEALMASLPELRLEERIVEAQPKRAARDPQKEVEALTRSYRAQGMSPLEAARQAAIDLAGKGDDQ